MSEQELKTTGLPLQFVFAAVTAAAILGYFTAFGWMLPIWLDGGSHYSHGLLVIGVVGFRLWQDKARLVRGAMNNRSLVILWLALLGASAVWFMSTLSGIQVPGTLAALAAMWLGMSIAIGRGGVWRLLPYFVLLYSVVPIWQPYLNPMLQAMATEVVNTLLRLLDLTIYMEGNTIVMPNIVFQIIGGCSGLGYLLVALTLAIYLVLADHIKGVSAALLIASFIGLGLVSNWIRITLIMLFGYVEGPTHPLVGNHVWFGWLVYSVIFLPALWFLPPRFVKMSAHFSTKTNEETRPNERFPRAVFLGTIAAMLTLPVLALVIAVGTASRSTDPVLLSPGPAYSELQLAPVTWQPEYPLASVVRLQHFRPVTDSKVKLMIFQAFYPNQRDGIEVTDSTNKLEGVAWVRDQHNPSTVQIGYGNGAASELELTSVDGSRRLLLWYWYQVGGSQVSSEIEAKAAQILGKLQFRGNGSLVAVATHCSMDGCDAAKVRLGDFVQTLAAD